jgi:hypothetical protein
MTVRRIASAAALLCAATSLALAPGALAKTYVPNTTGDHVPGTKPSKLTLREATIKAKNHGGADTIVLQSGKRYELSQPKGAESDMVQTGGDLDIFDTAGKGLTIRSSGSGLATVDANGIDGVFECLHGCTFQRIKVTGGRALDLSEDGGGIEGQSDDPVGGTRAGRITLIDSRVSGNQAESDGGGVSSEQGGLMLLRSVVSGNQAGGQGGGLDVEGPVSIKQSTVKSNHAGTEGGGIYNGIGTLSVKQSTVSGNTATDNGGGVFNLTVMRLTNDTLAKNAAQAGGGLYHSGSATLSSLNAVTIAYNTVTTDLGGGVFADFSAPAGSFRIANSIVAKNAGVSFPDCNTGPMAQNPVASNGHNLFGVGVGCNPAPGDRHDLSNSKIGLASGLANNGGLTKTIALKSSSKAIDNAASSAPGKDQRGVRRNDPGGPDIGAFERN